MIWHQNQYGHEVDLHGVKHGDVEGIVCNELYNAENNRQFPVKFITGNSRRMKQLVIETAETSGYFPLHQVFPQTTFVLVQE